MFSSHDTLLKRDSSEAHRRNILLELAEIFSLPTHRPLLTLISCHSWTVLCMPLPQKLCICPFLCLEYFSNHSILLVKCYLFREVVQTFPGLLYKLVTSLSLRLLPQPALFFTVAINTQFFYLLTCSSISLSLSGSSL